MTPPLAQIDRFVFPADDVRPSAFILDCLYVAHSVRERVALPWRRARNGRNRARPVSPAALSPASRAAIEAAVSRAAGLRSPGSWIVDTDYPGSSRNRSVVFLFDDRSRCPVMVIKRAPGGSGRSARSLAREREALESIRASLCAPMRPTVPRVVFHESRDGWESLGMEWLPGRSAYVEMQTALRPAARVDTHFRAAAGWLARFHDATVLAGKLVGPPSLTVDSEPDWLLELHEACARVPVQAVRSQGDFWARNVLLARDRGGSRVTGVVDWEESTEAASPYEDLFHFVLTYGLGYPWSRYRRVAAETAFRRTFLEENRISRAVRGYFRVYCDARGLELRLLDSWLRCYLRALAQRDGPEGAVWSRCEGMMAAAGRSVFSG